MTTELPHLLAPSSTIALGALLGQGASAQVYEVRGAPRVLKVFATERVDALSREWRTLAVLGGVPFPSVISGGWVVLQGTGAATSARVAAGAGG